MSSGCSRFEGFELVYQLVVLGVGEFGRVEYVVEVLVVAEFVAKVVDLLFQSQRHEVIIKRAGYAGFMGLDLWNR